MNNAYPNLYSIIYIVFNASKALLPLLSDILKVLKEQKHIFLKIIFNLVILCQLYWQPRSRQLETPPLSH